MESEICAECNIEKLICDVYKKNTECENCMSKRDLNRYYATKGKMSKQHKLYYKESKKRIFQR